MTAGATASTALGAWSTLQTASGPLGYVRLGRLAELGLCEVERLPLTTRILLESVVRQAARFGLHEDELAELVRAVAGERPEEDGCERRWSRAVAGERPEGDGRERAVVGEWSERSGREDAERTAPVELPFLPARVLLQDFTGLPALVDLAAMRGRLADPTTLDLALPADLVIDHSVRVDHYGTQDARRRNLAAEYGRNRERYGFLRWAEQAFANLHVVPPGRGICHQVNFERLAEVVTVRRHDGGPVALPDTVLGSDSHTPMVNGLGVLGWGVGGIEVEAALLGRPLVLTCPQVVGLRLTNALPPGALATDLVLAVTELLRRHGVVDRFVEVFGPGVATLSVPDRGVVANMAPDFGATACLFGIDERTLDFLRLTNRSEATVDLVERYARAQALFGEEAGEAEFDEVVELDLGTVEPSLAGPDRPDQRRPLAAVPRSFAERAAKARDRSAAEGSARESSGAAGDRGVAEGPVEESSGAAGDGAGAPIPDGSVVIAAITSCTNTSSPEGMLAAGLLAKHAVDRGLQAKPWVKTSLAPGSPVVAAYLDRAGLMPYLERLGFDVVGFGCTTCCGNSGPLPDAVERALDEHDADVVAVLSGNRNYAGRIHPRVRANYLASPPLVVAYALAGRIDVNLEDEPLADGVTLEDLWPTRDELAAAHQAIRRELFEDEYAALFEGDDAWRALPAPTGPTYAWTEDSTYLRPPPFVRTAKAKHHTPSDIHGARALLVLGDHVTTDHISPVGRILRDSPAGRYLQDRGVHPRDFDSFGTRRGNWEVMVRGTFDYVALRNALAAPEEGGVTVHVPSGERMTVFDAAQAYGDTPLVIVAGDEYGAGSSRDWAAKGTALLGIRAVLAVGFERIHRANLVGMGVVPLQIARADRDRLTGTERFDVLGLDAGIRPGGTATVVVDGTTFTARVRVDTEQEARILRAGGILPLVLSELEERR
ncbi:MAG TPA: aconitate hydratase AcnA [Solirubrobacteraceae bacterium]|jgi:aconitate hydratase|nr:aconitate hydratase AcnA [Solirubrobacteraceae bacterium]